MMSILELKEQIKLFYQKAGFYLQPLGRFIFSLIIFMLLNRELGFNERLNGMEVVLALAVVCAVTPSAVLVFLAAAVTVAHVYAVSNVLALLVAVIFFIMLCFFMKIAPYTGYTVVLIPLLFMIRIPYCAPLLLGMVGNPLSVAPVSLGILVYYLIEVIKGTGSANLSVSVEDILALYKSVMDTWLGNREMYMVIGVFAAVLLITYLIRRQDFPYSFEIAIIAGGVLGILGFLAANLFLEGDFAILPIVTGNLVSMFLVFVIWFFRMTLDYTAVERLQFEDDDYYYYVKAVPKMKVTAREKNVKRISEKKETDNEEL